MNRRSFLDSMLKAAAACAVLPAATTYARAVWKKNTAGVYVIANPEYRDAPIQEYVHVWLGDPPMPIRMTVLCRNVPKGFEKANFVIEDPEGKLNYIKDPYPRRFKHENGKTVEVKPFIWLPQS